MQHLEWTSIYLDLFAMRLTFEVPGNAVEALAELKHAPEARALVVVEAFFRSVFEVEMDNKDSGHSLGQVDPMKIDHHDRGAIRASDQCSDRDHNHYRLGGVHVLWVEDPEAVLGVHPLIACFSEHDAVETGEAVADLLKGVGVELLLVT